MLKLHITADQQQVQTGSTRLSWCVDQPTREALATAEVENPQLLIVVAPEVGYSMHRERRWLVPLMDAACFVGFSAPGTNRVFGMLVTEESPEDTYLTKRRSEWSTTVLVSTGEKFLLELEPKNIPDPTHAIEVTVPAKCFAKPLSKFEAWWLNWFPFFDDMTDQCAARKRRPFAYLLQPFIALIWYTLKAALACAIFGVGLLCGVSGWNYRDLFTYKDIEDLGFYVNRSVFMPKKSRHWLLRAAAILLMPPFLIVVFTVSVFGATDPAFLKALQYTLCFMAVVSVPTGLVGLGIEWKIRNNAEARTTGTWQPPFLRPTADYLVCETAATTRHGSPSVRVRFRLSFLDLKSRMCKPFAS